MTLCENAFDFVKIDMPPDKPRSVGVSTNDYEGFFTRPMSFMRTREKFDKLASQFVNDSLRVRIVDAIANLEKIKIRELMALLEK